MVEALLVLANLLTCMAGVVLCICRMGKMTKSVKAAIRHQYNFMLPVLFASAFSWLYGYPATPIQFFMGAAMAFTLLSGVVAWRHGAPDYAIKT